MSTPDTGIHDVIIVGSGPAGLTAAIYTARANLEPLVIEGEPSSTTDQPGGQLMLTTEVENFPGFPTGIMGPELMIGMREQALRFGADIRTEKVTKVDLSARPFGVWVGDPDAAEPTYRGQTIIVSTGAQSLMLDLPRETELIGHGVSTCATCDGFFFRDQHIAVVGGGDSAIEEATFLTKFASKVTIIHRRDELRASQDHAGPGHEEPQDRVPVGLRRRGVPGRHQARRHQGPQPQDRRDLRDATSPACSSPSATAPTPTCSRASSPWRTTATSSPAPSGTEMESATDVDGVFACGDVQDHTYRQAITAAGSGCMAAIDAERWLENSAGLSPRNMSGPDRVEDSL